MPVAAATQQPKVPPTLAQDYGPLHEGFDLAFTPAVAYVRQGNKVCFFTGSQQLAESIDEDVQVVGSIDEMELVERQVDERTVTTVKDGQWVVEGPFQRSDTPNANRRFYVRKIWERIFGDGNSRQQQMIKARAMIGHLEHPADGRMNGKEGALVVTESKLRPDGVVWGKAELLDTPNGLILQEYTRKRVRWGVSSRGNGAVGADGKVDENTYDLETFDAVLRPSTPGAFPQPIQMKAPNTRGNKSLGEDDVNEGAGAATKFTSAGALRDYVNAAAKGAAVSLFGVRATVVTPADEASGASILQWAANGKTKKGIVLDFIDAVEKATGKSVKEDDDDPATVAENQNVEDDGAESCAQVVESLNAVPVESLDEASGARLVGHFLKQFGRASALSATGKMTAGQRDALHGTIDQRVGAIMRSVARARRDNAEGAIDEGVEGSVRDEALARIVNTLQGRANALAKDLSGKDTALLAEQARRQTAEERLVEMERLLEVAVEKYTKAITQLSEARQSLSLAESVIVQQAESDDDPVRAEVEHAVRGNPRLEPFRKVLERAESADEVLQLVMDLQSGQASLTEGQPATTEQPPPTLPSAPNLLSESTAGNRGGTGGRASSSKGARMAGRALASSRR